MKIVLTVQTASDGGVFITMDPGAPELLEQQLAGKGTAAHTYALAAFRTMHDMAKTAAAAGGQLETGEISGTQH